MTNTLAYFCPSGNIEEEMFSQQWQALVLQKHYKNRRVQ
jgi:hypothetical protein